MRKVFLGKYAHRNLQKQYEDVTTEEERCTLTFPQMVEKFRTKFKLSSNVTLCNYKFRQAEGESFNLFVIRVRKEAQACDFKCDSANCTVRDTLIRDQLLIGTKNDEIRSQALKEEWSLDAVISKGRAIEAASKGAAEIKVKEESTREVNRTGKPGKYSRKGQQRKDMDSRKSFQKRCKLCSSIRCDGSKNCPGKKGSCFACGLKGHFRGADICKKTSRRRTRRVDEETTSESEGPSDEENTPEQSEEEEDE